MPPLPYYEELKGITLDLDLEEGVTLGQSSPKNEIYLSSHHGIVFLRFEVYSLKFAEAYVDYKVAVIPEKYRPPQYFSWCTSLNPGQVVVANVYTNGTVHLNVRPPSMTNDVAIVGTFTW